jgi:hypothetical protein
MLALAEQRPRQLVRKTGRDVAVATQTAEGDMRGTGIGRSC